MGVCGRPASRRFLRQTTPAAAGHRHPSSAGSGPNITGLFVNRKYVTVTWYDPGTTNQWHYPENVTFAFYQADHPWGPWSYIGEKSCCDFLGDTKQRISRWYGPLLSPRFITANPDGSVTAILTFSGQLWDDTPDSLYKNNCCPVVFYTAPQLKEVRTFNDTEANYLRRQVSIIAAAGVSAIIEMTSMLRRRPAIMSISPLPVAASRSFPKSTTTWAAWKSSSTASPREPSVSVQDPMPRLYQVEFYRNMNLSHRRHALRVVNKGPEGKFCLIDGFRVYDIVVVQASEARATPAEVIARLVGASAATFTNQETKRRTKWIR